MMSTNKLLVLFTISLSPWLQHDDVPVSRSATDSLQRWLDGPVRLLLTSGEARIAARSDSPAADAAFRSWFWARRDPTPGTPTNEFREEFFERVAFADREFGDRRAGRPGWDTPRGTIHLLLGPPSRVRQVHNGIVAAGAFHDLTVWSYDVSGRSFKVPFVELARGPAIAVDPRTGALPQELTNALSRAVVDAVSNPDLPFGAPLVDGVADGRLPIRFRAGTANGVIEGEFAAPLRELYGRPDGDGMLLDLRIDHRGAGVAKTRVEGDDDHGMTSTHLRVRLSGEQLAQWSDHDLRVLITLPAATFRSGQSASLHVTELPTGRSAIAETVEARVTPRDGLAIAHLLVLEEILGGAGALAAFFEAKGEVSGPASELWIAAWSDVRGEGEVLRSAGNLQLFRRRTGSASGVTSARE